MSLQRTVPDLLWDELAEACGSAFADSYLSGAALKDRNLIPHTVTAYMALRRVYAARQTLDRLKIKLIEPLPFGHPERHDTPKRKAA